MADSRSKSLPAGEDNKQIDVKCPEKQPNVGDICPDGFFKNKKIKCPFRNKHGAKIFSCPDKKWAFTMVFPPKGSTLTREKNGAKNDKRCPKKEPKELWGIPCD